MSSVSKEWDVLLLVPAAGRVGGCCGKRLYKLVFYVCIILEGNKAGSTDYLFILCTEEQ